MRTRVRWTQTTETGDLVTYAAVRVYEADGTTVYTGPIFRDNASDLRHPNPFNAVPVRVEFYLDRQARVVLGLRSTPGAPEILTPLLEALPDADEVAYAIQALKIPAAQDQLSLRAHSASEAYWYRPGLGEHHHAGPGVNATAVGAHRYAFSQIPGYDSATLLGGHDDLVDPTLLPLFSWGSIENSALTWGSLEGIPFGDLDQAEQSVLTTPTGFEDTTAVGVSSVAAGRTATAAGPRSRAVEASDGSASTALGTAQATGTSLAAGHDSYAGGADAVALGAASTATATGTTLNGAAPREGLSLGHRANAAQYATAGSVVLGAHIEAPVRQDATVVLGPGTPPDLTDVEALALVLQALTTQIPGDLTAEGDVTLGVRQAQVGFFGRPGTTPVFVGDDEVASGIEALDSLIYALRDLGLLRSRRDAVARYTPEGIAQTHRTGDEIREWPLADGAAPRMVSALYTEPHATTDPVRFDADRTPWEFLLTESVVPTAFKHVVVVARHTSQPPRSREGLAGVYGQAQPLARIGAVWSTAGLSRHTVDSMTQNPALPVDTAQHVYRVTHASEWTPDLFILGASADPATAGWWGTVSEVTLLDSSWSELNAVSLTDGLLFLYNIRKSADWMTTRSLDFLRSQQGELLSNPVISLDTDYPSSDTARVVAGTVTGFTGVSGPKTVPLIRVGLSAILAYAYTGAMSGYWSYLTNPADHLIELYSFPDGFTGTWSADALVGRFALNLSGTWSTGRLVARRGEKRWRLVTKTGFTPVTSDVWVPGGFYDTAVLIYTEDETGARTLEDTVPLQGDGTWFGTTENPGRVVAELRRRSLNTLYATTDLRLPLDVLPRAADTDFADASVRGSIRTAALTVLAYTDAGRRYWGRAGDILRDLMGLQETDGSLFAAYDVVTTDPLGTEVSARSLAQVGVAALAHSRATGDLTRFWPLILGIAEYLMTQQDMATGAVPDQPAILVDTVTDVWCWLFFRDLARDTADPIYRVIAEDIATALDTLHWDDDLGGFSPEEGALVRDTQADIWGGLYLLATGQRARATRVRRSLAYAKRTGVAATDSYYTGATGLAGYRPTNTAGSLMLDQEATWAALLFRSRYGDPIGADILALKRMTAMGPTPFAPLVNYSGPDAGLIVRPATAVAAMGVLLAARTTLFWPLPPAPPEVSACRLTVSRTGTGHTFLTEWQVEDWRVPVAYEVVAERSFDDGVTWIAMPSRSRKGQVSEVRIKGEPNFPWSFHTTWTESGPLSGTTVTRVNIRMRAKDPGSWVTTEARYPSGQILPPPPLVSPAPPPSPPP